MAIKLITPPAAEPVTLAEAKAHCRVDHSADDARISAYIAAARQDCERWTGRAFVTQTWELVIDEFPEDEIQIPLPPLQSVVSVKYDDGNGTEQTIASTEYVVDDVSEPGWVVPAIGGWPSTFDGINAVRVQFVAGYAPDTNSPVDLAANVPPSIKQAILLLTGQYYDNREDIVVGTTVYRLPTGASESLLRMFRVALGMA